MSKYGNIKTIIDGYKFDSKKEGNRYIELKMLQLGKQISDLKLQPKYHFPVNGGFVTYESGRKLSYSADFSYIENGLLVVEDVKSPATAKEKAFRIKKALMKACHDIDIRLS